MRDRPEVVVVVREWVAKAENDWKAVFLALRGGKESPVDVACFHAQQCVEKYAKALLVLRGIAFPKTHSIRLLLELLPEDERPVLDRETQDRLTEFATVTRYPGDYEPLVLSEARKLTRVIRRIRGEIRHCLPKAALRRNCRS